MLIDQLKISTDLHRDYGKKLQKILIGTKNSKATGYLLFETEQDRRKSLYSCHLFSGSSGTIIITDYKHMLEDAISFHCSLNSHVTFAGVKIGQDEEDFMNCRHSAAITFTFNVTGKLCDALGI